MGWAIGQDGDRDIGYGVVAYCDHPGCMEKIDRGLGYVCCEEQPYGGENGCGLYFCAKHSNGRGKCERCQKGEKPFTMKADHPDWIAWKLTDDSWSKWRAKNREWVAKHDTPQARARGAELQAENS